MHVGPRVARKKCFGEISAAVAGVAATSAVYTEHTGFEHTGFGAEDNG